MWVDLEVFYLGHLKNLYTIQYNTISLKFGTEFDNMTPDLQQTLKVKGSKPKVKVTA